VPRGFYWDAQRNRLFKLDRGAPAEFVAAVHDERAQAAAAAAAAHIAAAQAALRTSRSRLPTVLLARELSGAAPSGVPSDWLAQLRRCHVGAWRHSAVQLVGASPFLDGVHEYERMAVHPSLGTLVVHELRADRPGRRILVSRALVRHVSAAGLRCEDAAPSDESAAAGSLEEAFTTKFRFSINDLPMPRSLDVSPCTQRLLHASAQLGDERTRGRVNVCSYARSDDDECQWEFSERATLSLQRGSLWGAQWVADDALALAASAESPSPLVRVRPDGTLVQAATIVDDALSDVFTFGLAHDGSGGGCGPQQTAAVPVLYVGRRNGDVLLWDARQGGATRGGGGGSGSGSSSSPHTVMHVPSSVVAVQPLAWPLVAVADADETLQVRDCRKSSVPVAAAPGYRNNPRRLPVVVSPDRRFVAAACSGADGAVVRTWDHRLALLHTSTREERLGGGDSGGGDGGGGATSAAGVGAPQPPPPPPAGNPPQIAFLPPHVAPPAAAIRAAAAASARPRGLDWPALLVADGARLGLLH
jgi:hypothetical protein